MCRLYLVTILMTSYSSINAFDCRKEAYYELRFGCPASGYGYIVGYGPIVHSARNTDTGTVTSFNQCLQECSDSPWCERTAWFAGSGLCYLYNYFDFGNDEPSCMMSVKKCPENVEDPRYDEAVTTPDPVVGLKSIADRTSLDTARMAQTDNREKCSEEGFEMLPRTAANKGFTTGNKISLDECAAVCKRAQDNCVAFTYNIQEHLCTLHNKAEAKTVRRGQNDCCNFFRKRICQPKKCYNGYGSDATDWNFILCDGVCYTQYIEFSGNTTSTTSRGCDNGKMHAQKERCYVEQQLNDNGQPTSWVERCNCDTSHCNYIATSMYKEMVLHLPLDRNTDDLSERNKHGQPHNILYDDVEHIRGSSAYFSGTSFITIPAFVGVSLFPYRGSKEPCFTLSLWFKTQWNSSQYNGSKGLVFGNNVVTMSTTMLTSQLKQRLELVVSPNNGNRRIIQVVVPLDQWIHLTIVGTQNANTDQTSMTMTAYELTTKSTTTESITLQATSFISHEPLYFGGRPDKDQYMTGFIDEIFMFQHCLSPSETITMPRTDVSANSLEVNTEGSGDSLK